MSVPQKIVDYVSKRETTSILDIAEDLRVSQTTARNYLSRLAKIGYVKSIGRGLYQRAKEGFYQTANQTRLAKLPPDLWDLAKKLQEQFPMADFTVWSLAMLSDYAHYALNRNLVFVETKKLLSASFQDALANHGYTAIPNPSEDMFRNYTYFSPQTAFILEREEKYGLVPIEGFLVPTLERMWLDVYYFITRKNLSFDPFELGLIFKNILSRDGINFNRLLRYATRRNLRDEVIIFLYCLKTSSSVQQLIPENVLFGRRRSLETMMEMIDGAKKGEEDDRHH